MKNQYDLKKEWEKTKKILADFSKEAAQLAKKGETEFVAFSRRSKIQLDATTAHLKMEKLYYFIGKEYAGLKDPSAPSDQLTKLMKELQALKKEEKTLKSRIAKPKAKRAPKKKTKKS